MNSSTFAGHGAENLGEEAVNQLRDGGDDDYSPVMTRLNLSATGITVVKIGGSTLGSHDTTLEDIVALQRSGVKFVVVHGGGNTISEWMSKQGIRPRFIKGLRVTDASSLQIVVAVLTGLINKTLVASLIALGGKAIGLSGIDGGMIKATVSQPELGYVGKIEAVDPQPITGIIESGNVPVIAPVGIDTQKGPHESGSILNINGDTVAGAISASLCAKRLVFLTDVEGVLDSSRRLIPRLTAKQVERLVISRVVQGGMLPKIESCLNAITTGGVSHIIDGRRPNALSQIMSGEVFGTRIN